MDFRSIIIKVTEFSSENNDFLRKFIERVCVNRTEYTSMLSNGPPTPPDPQQPRDWLPKRIRWRLVQNVG